MRGYKPRRVLNGRPSDQGRRAGKWHMAARAAHGIRLTRMVRPCAACAMDGACGRDVTTARVGRAEHTQCVQEQ